MPDERKEFEELTIKFGKGLAEDFTGKDGKAQGPRTGALRKRQS